MNILTCPHCDVPLSTINRREVRCYLVENITSMTLSVKSTDQLKRDKPTWKGVRYWLKESIAKKRPFEEARLNHHRDQQLRQYRTVEYRCSFCELIFNPGDQGWVDPLDVLPYPEGPHQENENTYGPGWEEYLQYGSEPSLMLESELVLDVV